MNVLVITNNRLVYDELGKQNFEIEYVEGKAEKSLLHSRDLIVSGWHLAADPRGGYNKRFNPYHTIFLSDEEVNDVGEEVLILETAALFRDSPYSPCDMHTAQEMEDFQILDASIARRTASRLKPYVNELAERKRG